MKVKASVFYSDGLVRQGIFIVLPPLEPAELAIKINVLARGCVRTSHGGREIPVSTASSGDKHNTRRPWISHDAHRSLQVFSLVASVPCHTWIGSVEGKEG
jgi:hypothetical protein